MISLSPLALLSVSLCGIVIGYCIHAFLFAKLGYYWTDDLRCSCGKPVGSPDFNPYGMIIHERVNYLDVVCESCVDIAVARENRNFNQLEKQPPDDLLEASKIDAEFESDSLIDHGRGEQWGTKEERDRFNEGMARALDEKWRKSGRKST